MVKKYYPGETKEQRKARKQLEKETGKKVVSDKNFKHQISEAKKKKALDDGDGTI